MTRGIAVGVWWNVFLLAASLLALPFDHRLILGLNPWIKPLKFEISVIVFLLTVGLLLKLLGESGRHKTAIKSLGWGFGISMIAENTIIALQSARGVRSHMNIGTPFDAAAFGIMGAFIAFNTLLLLIVLWFFCRTRLNMAAAELWGIRLGLAMIAAGSAEGFVMVASGGHTVGAADGGPGLPFLNWSTQHGDFRVAHFFALHALQFLWAAGWALSRMRLRREIAVTAIWLTALVYAAFVLTLFSQALGGRPLVATTVAFTGTVVYCVGPRHATAIRKGNWAGAGVDVVGEGIADHCRPFVLHTVSL